VLAGKRVMRQSLFADEPLVLPEPGPAAVAPAPQAPPIAVYALAGAALLVAVVALAVALLR